MTNDTDTPSAVLDSVHSGDIQGAFGRIRQGDVAPRRRTSLQLRTLLAIIGPGLILLTRRWLPPACPQLSRLAFRPAVIVGGAASASIHVRREALTTRMEVGDLHRRPVAAGRCS